MTDRPLDNLARLLGCTHVEDRTDIPGGMTQAYYGVIDGDKFVTVYGYRRNTGALHEFDYEERFDAMKRKPEPIP